MIIGCDILTILAANISIVSLILSTYDIFTMMVNTTNGCLNETKTSK